MTLENRLKSFIKRATKFHKNKFDYSLVGYVNANTKVKIICPEHGEFLQTPYRHLAPNNKGCVKCWHNILSVLTRERMKVFDYSDRTMTKEVFLKKCREKYGNKFEYNLNNFKGLRKSKVRITCPKHGDFITNASTHLAKTNTSGCQKCKFENMGRLRCRPYEDAIKICAEKHNNKYEYPDYNKENYVNNRSILEIICKKHGVYKCSVAKHSSGQGCFRCKMDYLIETNVLVGGYSEELFDKRPELKSLPAILYYFKINNGKYYKIGISRQEASKRINYIKYDAKIKGELIDIEIIKIKQDILYKCFLSEQQILNDYKEIRVFRRWSTELLCKDILPEINHLF